MIICYFLCIIFKAYFGIHFLRDCINRNFKPEKVQLAIKADGALSWNGETLAPAALEDRLATAASRQPQPELHLHADRNTRYEAVASLMASAQQAGLVHISFATQAAQQ